MKAETFTIEVSEEPGIHHIPGVHNMQQSLCGYVDVIHESHPFETHPCNCRRCIDALNKIKALRFPAFYFDQKGGRRDAGKQG